MDLNSSKFLRAAFVPMAPGPLSELDMDSMRSAAAMLVGTHDFSSFRAINSDLPFKNPVKTMDLISIQPGASFSSSHFHRHIPFCELKFKSKSFLYKQVRRMVGALVAVGTGRLSPLDLERVKEARDSRAFPQGLAAPPQGLFLTHVEYRDADLQLPTTISEDALSTNPDQNL
uniref:tRNA pseudouridine synthase n=1 Tax=Knipowitschia caucasica TaxID=637954 RepID=A0AAV2M4V2_KNICA